MSDYPMLISNKLHSFRNFPMQSYITESDNFEMTYGHYAIPNVNQ